MILLLPTLLLSLVPAAADQLDRRNTAQLYSSCRSFVRVNDHDDQLKPADVYGADYCLGYMNGYFTVLGLYSENGRICVSDATRTTLARVYTTFMDQHPKLFDEQQGVGFTLAIQANYGCPTEKNQK